MTAVLSFVFEITLCVLLAATLVYCFVLERRLRSVRAGQEEMKSTIGHLNTSLAAAGASLRAMQTAAGTVGETLDRRVVCARAAIDELSLVTASAERIAQRMERTVDTQAAVRTPMRPVNANLPSGSIMGRLDALRAAR
jgi:hypothetical protein